MTSSTSIRIPATGEELPRETADAEAVRRALMRAREAQEEWASRPLRERTRPLLCLHDLLLDRGAEAMDLIQLETGKARAHAFEEVGDTAAVARYYARSARRHLRERRRRTLMPFLTEARERHVARGVVGLIAPWNYPLTLALTDALPALAAGNAVVLKPDVRAAGTARWAEDLVREAGVPADAFQVVPGPGEELGPPLVEGVDFVGFTGSTETGREVASRAGESLTPCSLELGGKNPMVVLEDAELERAVDGALRGCYSSAGQLCLSLERIYVEAGAFRPFVDRLVPAVRGLRLGVGLDWVADVGSLASPAQLAKTEAHVQDAVERGATVLAGGRRRPEIGPFVYEPTLLAGVRPGMRVHREETFGPVAWVEPVRDPAEAVERANDTAYGLNASVWTRDLDLGRRVAARIRAGTVNVNDAYAAAWSAADAPMGGMDDSGIGRRHGEEGILKYTESQTVAVQRGLPPTGPPSLSGRAWAAVASAYLRARRLLPWPE